MNPLVVGAAWPEVSQIGATRTQQPRRSRRKFAGFWSAADNSARNGDVMILLAPLRAGSTLGGGRDRKEVCRMCGASARCAQPPAEELLMCHTTTPNLTDG